MAEPVEATYSDIPGFESDLLTPLAGGLVLAAYAAVLAALGYLLSTRREVS